MIVLVSIRLCVFAQSSDQRRIDVSQAQLLKKDTSEYIEKNIIGNKQKYISKPLDSLLTDLPAPILSYIPSVDFNNKNNVPGIILSFFDSNTTNNQIVNNKRMTVVVTFNQPVSRKDVEDLYSKDNGNWSDDDKTYFDKKIVKDLAYVR